MYTEHGLKQRCWYSAGHGYDNLSEAVRDSCNVYFYTMGWDLGIEHLNKTAADYGLAQPTGIELAESTGHLAGPEFAATIPGGVWYPGNVTSAAIGQSDNQFTVLQLANYIATFCRGGKRLDAHLLKNAKSSDNTAIIAQHKSKKMGEVKLSSDTQKAIATGMGQVIEADKITFFKDLEDSGVKVGCKTGTAQLGHTGLYNDVFVAFAPVEDPEIIVATVVEKSPYSGAESSNITADIMSFYFSESAALTRTQAENQLVK
jgi:penicillin-binding protein 2